MEEMGLDIDLGILGRFTYRAEDPESGLVEAEVDDVLAGIFIGEPHPNPDEASAWRWVEVGELERDLADRPDHYTPWLRPALGVFRG